MKKSLLLLIFLYTACSAPQKSSEIATNADTITYNYDSIRQVSTAGKGGPAEAMIIFPAFVDSAVNQTLESAAAKADSYPGTDDYRSLIAGFIRNYEHYIAEGKGSGHPWFLKMDIHVLFNEPGFVSVLNTFSTFEGGAHPNTVYLSYNINPATASILTIDSLIMPDKMGDLHVLAERIFRENEQLTPIQSLAGNYFFKDDIFALAQAFNLKHEGLLFTYSPYEIKPYAAGKTELLIPAPTVKKLLRPKYQTLFSSENQL